MNASWIYATSTACLLAGMDVASAAVACSLSASPVAITGIYASGASLDVQGTFNIACTRNPATDPRKPDIWIGIDQTSPGRTMTRDIGGSQLTYVINRKSFTAGLWTNTGSLGPNANGAGGLGTTIDFGPGGGAATTEAFSFFFRVAAGQTTAPAGIFLDTAIPVTMRLNDDAGNVLSTATLSATVSIQHHCRFSSDPTPISVNYPAFAATAVPGVSSFTMTCTQGTPYTLALDATRSIVPVVELAYTLSVSAATGTGTAAGQAYSVNVNFPAGQAGKCSSSNCSGTDTRTITVTY